MIRFCIVLPFESFVPSGTSNPQGAAAFLLASRIWATDPDVVYAQRKELLYDGGYFYIKWRY